MRIHPLADLYPAMTEDEFKALVADIHQHGLRQPILLHPDGSILDGRHRWRAIDDLADQGVIVELRFQEWDGSGDLVSLIHSLNFHRRHLSVTQKACIGVGYKRELQKTVKPGRPENNCGNNTAIVDRTPDARTPDARTQAAAKVGVSGKVVDIAEGISEVAPDLFADMQAGEISLWEAQREVKHRAVERARQELKDHPIPLPTGTYRCIVIDPPWPIEKIEREARPNQSSSLDYPTMTLEEIEALPIADMASLEGCHVYLWVTQKFLREGFRLFEAWGVRYQCLMTWVKPTGMTPYSWMYNTEHILFGRVGSLPLERMGLKLSLDAPATGHSVKPAAFYERVSEASPPPRIELFARAPRPGFDGWGNESLTLEEGSLGDE